jgi:hypothetical protein
MLTRLRAWWDRRRGRVLRALFRGWPDDPGGAGVREPRRPRQPSLSGAAALDERRDDQLD